jgi:hypothetical protein
MTLSKPIDLRVAVSGSGKTSFTLFSALAIFSVLISNIKLLLA